jgi:uncharacterized membrane protein YqhA
VTGRNDELARTAQRRFERVLTASRLLTLIPVVFLLLDAAGSFIYGTDIFVRTASDVISEPAKIGGRLGIFLIVMDTFLVGATLMIAAFGFYELFIIKGEQSSSALWLPKWLRMRDLEDLKARVVSMLILVAAITFVDRTVESQDQQEILFLGIGISIIIAALTTFLWFSRRNPPEADLAVVTGDNGGSGGDDGGGPATADISPKEPRGVGAASLSDPLPAGAPAATTHSASAAEATPRPARASEATRPPATAQAAAPGPASPAVATPRPAKVMAILAGTRRVGNWSVAKRTDVITAAGWARFDLREAALPAPQVALRVIAGLGVVSITVPPHMDVAESGFTLLGIRSIRGGPATPSRTGATELVLSGACVLGIVLVRRTP